jgi:Zn-dependent protease
MTSARPVSQAVEPRGDARGSRGGLSLGRLLGVRLHVDWSVLIIFTLILFNLGAGSFPAAHPDWGPGLVWGTAVGAALLFFASILAHELSHAVVARRNDIPVERITLFLFGGLAHLEREPPSPKSEFAMAIIGPITSLVIGLVALLVGVILAGPDFRGAWMEDPEGAVRGLGPAASLLLWLGPINILLAVFNMVPGFPLDGGRVFRSIAWWITDDLRKATRWASAAGRLFAWALMAWGLLNVLGGAVVQGVWLLLIGWFLNNAARMGYQDLVIREALRGVPISRIMRTRLTLLAPEVDIETVVRQELMASGQRAFPVVGADGALLGLVCLQDLRRIPQEQWRNTTLGAVMTPVERLDTLPPEASATQAFKALARRDVDQIPIVDGNRPVGILHSQDVLKWLSLHMGDDGHVARAAA